ncbi:MAG: hypothetical protein IKE76_02080, partial [Clostridia bacterium]|nr:hypothetical protein [Clostridia bacterium]
STNHDEPYRQEITVMPGTEMNTPESLKRSLEVGANRFNLKCLAVLCGFTVLCAVCNRIGVFTVDPVTMRVAVITALLFFCLPIVVWIVHDGICKRTPTILSHGRFKYLIILSTYVGITVTCVTPLSTRFF